MFVETVAETASTNADVKALALAGSAPEGFWLRAETQTGGVGRRGRKWESPQGNLFCSTIVDLRPGNPEPSSLSFVAGLAVHATLRNFLPDAPMLLKWPNDVLVSDAKICGVLLERVKEQVVVGIGVNIAQAPQVEGRAVTSLKQEGAITDAAAFLDRLSKEFEAWVTLWREAGLARILKEWQMLAHPVGMTVTTSDIGGDKISGKFAGLTADGALRLRKADGTLIEIRAGDISIG
ncbi:biotin--[acetyl-CoA-carboxylase] ligase [Sphingorhabdus sp. 109]|uniref:biotin--[acetyl-CoA-carboxylase] ligase n=1 Tax=Sphingorhabdus sp. 109 TaxID=2653173 RepID=UPI001357A00A|nr:biotin--[acetyl-CoA-carboxylase] ligase [Sphingorhabdus sp. 109]